MPQKPNNQKKKKKGHSPAHQNNFSFQHNPKSKKTASILSTPIEHVCRRCRDKLDWRKKYRKYKPRTTPGKCNHCQKRNVRAAYHTICEGCTRTSSKSLALLKEWNNAPQHVQKVDAGDHQSEPSEECPPATENDATPEAESSSLPVEDVPEAAVAVAAGTAEPETHNSGKVHRRVCAMCEKEPAIASPDDYDDDEEEAIGQNGGRLSLRERKTLERRQERAANQGRRRNQRDVPAQEKVNEGDDASYDEREDGHGEKIVEEGDDIGEGDEEDPFLKAVGGAEKLLTGEAYQKMLLQKESNS